MLNYSVFDINAFFLVRFVGCSKSVQIYCPGMKKGWLAMIDGRLFTFSCSAPEPAHALVPFVAPFDHDGSLGHSQIAGDHSSR